MKATVSLLGIALVTIAGALAIVGAAGCNVGTEGERCDPSLSHNACNAGLSCQQPANCPENYCCPTSGPSSSPYCQAGCNGGQASICASGGDADCSDGGAD